MQKCEVCLNKFTWKQIEKSIWLGYRAIYCKKCSKMYRISTLSRILWSFITFGPMTFIPFIFDKFNLYKTLNSGLVFPVFLSILFGWVVVSQLVLPHIIKYDLAEDH